MLPSRTGLPLFFAVFLALVLPLRGAAQDKAAEMDTLLTKYHELGQFNGAALVSESGEVLYKKGFGDAVMEWDVPNTPSTKFRIGSVTKQFTAALILQLVEEGALRLDETVSEILPSYPTPQGEMITSHHLLTHSAGLPSYTGFADFEKNHMRTPYAPDSLVAVFAGMDLEFEPGTQFSYSNSGYFLLGAIIEEVTGQPYDDVLRQRLLDPLGLSRTGYDHYSDVIEQSAEGYVASAGGYERAPYLDTSVPYAADMMYSTVEDLYRWDQLLYTDRVFERPETKEKMLTPYIQNYGYGWMIHTVPMGDDSVQVAEHGGGINGFSTAFMRFVDDRHAVIVMDNTQGNAGQVAQGLAQILYGQTPPEPKPSIADAVRETIEQEGVEAAAERYRALKREQPRAYTFAEQELNRLGYDYLGEGDTDTAIAIFKLNVEAFPKAPNTYDSLGEAYLKDGDTTQAVENYKKSLALNPGNTNARKVLEAMGAEGGEAKEVSVPPEVLARYTGTYQVQPQFKIDVTREGVQLFVQATGQQRFPVYAQSETRFYLKAVDAQIEFNLDEAGEPKSLTLYQNGQEIPAEKTR